MTKAFVPLTLKLWRRYYLILFFTGIILSIHDTSSAETKLTLSQTGQSPVSLTPFLEIMEDPSAMLTLSDILTPALIPIIVFFAIAMIHAVSMQHGSVYTVSPNGSVVPIFFVLAYVILFFAGLITQLVSIGNWWVSGLNVTGGANSGFGISGASYNGASSKGLIFTADQTGQVIDTIGLRLIGVSPSFNQSSTLNLTIASVNQGTNALTGVLATDNVSYTSPPASDFATSVEYTFGPSFLNNIAQLNLTSGTKYAMIVWGAK